MEKSILAQNGVLPLVLGIPIFILLWAVVFETLKKVCFFKSRVVEAIVATCMSLLSIIGMFRFLIVGNRTYNVSERIGGGTDFDFVLIPYAALGIIIVLLSLYLFSSKLLRNDNPKKSLSDAKSGTDSIFDRSFWKNVHQSNIHEEKKSDRTKE